jgi:YfiH family protein
VLPLGAVLRAKTMKQHKVGDILYLWYERFEHSRNVTNIVTTRKGGRSAGDFASLNLGLHVGDDPDMVLENRAMICQCLAIEPEELTCANQVHGTTVAVVESDNRGRGAIMDDEAITGADAMVTNVAEVPLMVLVADCVAVSLYDPGRNAIGLAHAGWKGSLGRIVEKTVRQMTASFGTDPADVIAGVSPSIGKGHYEVGQEVFEAFTKEFGRDARRFIREDMDGTCYLDLWDLNAWQLRNTGLEEKHIEVAEMCTACHPSLFYSHRHENGRTGRFASLIMMHASGYRNY